MPWHHSSIAGGKGADKGEFHPQVQRILPLLEPRALGSLGLGCAGALQLSRDLNPDSEI